MRIMSGVPGLRILRRTHFALNPRDGYAARWRSARRHYAKKEEKKKAFNSGSAALVSALAALSEASEALSDFLVGNYL